MNSRYLCRGKRLDNGEWIEGYYYNIQENTTKHYILCYKSNTFHIMNVTKTIHEIDPKTIGQCTGIEDRNCKLIFEGHILRMAGVEHIGVVEWHEYEYLIVLHGEDTPFDNVLDFDFDDYNDIEIIGNIHDNPELLESE